jgi:hypothetical protein
MSRLAQRPPTHPEIMKLARLLGREPAELAYLERLAVDDLRRLRDGVTEVLYDSDAAVLRRMATASRLLPAGVIATLAQRAFGPLLSARLAGLLDLDRAVDVAGRLPPEFLADVAGDLDPRRASELITRISPPLIAQVTGELARRQDYVTMGRFVGHLSDGALDAALAALDGGALLQLSFLLEDAGQLERVLQHLPPSRLSDPDLQARIAQL